MSSQQPPVGITNPPVGITNPPVGITNPPVGITNPSVGITNPPVGITNPPVGITNPPVGITNPSVGITPITGSMIQPPTTYESFTPSMSPLATNNIGLYGPNGHNNFQPLPPPPSRNPPLINQPQRLVDPEKERLCVELFARSDIDLTMEQLNTLKWVVDNGVSQPFTSLPGITNETLRHIADYNGRIRQVIGCLLEITTHNGLFQAYKGRLSPKETFLLVYEFIRTLVDTTNDLREKYQTMRTMRNSISDESFSAIPWNNDDEKEHLIRTAASNTPLGGYILPEIYVFLSANGQRNPHANNRDLRERMLSIYDCCISIMRQLQPTLGGGKIRKFKKTYKNKKKKSIKNTKRKTYKNTKRKHK